jgi:group I intron endonuclease
MYTLYQITNVLNGKRYIGITKQSIQKRWEQHLGNSQNPKYPLHLAIAKHGADNFTITSLSESTDRKYIGELEDLVIQQLETHISKNGYNVAKGGYGGDLGPEANLKRKMTMENRSPEQTLKWKQNLSKAGLGKKRSIETKTKMSERQKARGGYGPKQHSMDTREKISTGNTGKVRTKIARQNYSNNAKIRGTGPQLQGKKVSCTCCQRAWDLGNFAQHIRRTREFQQEQDRS